MRQRICLSTNGSAVALRGLSGVSIQGTSRFSGGDRPGGGWKLNRPASSTGSA